MLRQLKKTGTDDSGNFKYSSYYSGELKRLPKSSYASTDLSSLTITPISGETVYLTDLKKKVLWNGSAWVNMDGSAMA